MSVKEYTTAPKIFQNYLHFSPLSLLTTALNYYITIYLRGEDGKDGELHLEGYYKQQRRM